MAKKSTLFTLITGLAAGAAAVVLSDPQKRQQAAQKSKRAQKTLNRIAKDYQKDPEGTLNKMKTQFLKLITPAQKGPKKTQSAKKKAAARKRKAKPKKVS